MWLSRDHTTISPLLVQLRARDYRRMWLSGWQMFICHIGDQSRPGDSARGMLGKFFNFVERKSFPSAFQSLNVLLVYFRRCLFAKLVDTLQHKNVQISLNSKNCTFLMRTSMGNFSFVSFILSRSWRSVA